MTPLPQQRWNPRWQPGFWLAAGLGFGLDRLTKWWVVQTFVLTQPPQSWPLWPGVFHFTYVTNTGAAFSLFTQGSDWLRWLSLAVSLGLMGYALWGPRLHSWEQWAYGFILAGAAGNGLDRFLLGHVIDFLDFRLIQFPIFNFADVAINLGLVCLIGYQWQRDRRSPARPPLAESDKGHSQEK
ncbi:MAG: lipoprotein signal peptidase [Gloeomargaritaceae cyanobacterium C42_A2020_066]|nr:lipoprotein signal peptidase [Gloeomargaritaceae cyanobacterium C42_A2020_066]